MKIIHYFIGVLFLISPALQDAAVIPVGAGGYRDDLPVGEKGPSDRLGHPVIPKTTPVFEKPPQTNQWWSSLIWQYHPENPWSENLFAHPLAFRAKSAGLGVSYPTKLTISPYVTQSKGHKTHEYHYNYAEDFVVGLKGLSAPKTVVKDYSPWTVTAEWRQVDKVLQATIGHGLPFAYFTSSGGPVFIDLKGTPNVWLKNPNAVGLTINGHHYAIFAPKGCVWTIGSDIEIDLKGKNYFSIALLPDAKVETLQYYQQRAFNFVTGATIKWDYDSPRGDVLATYTLETKAVDVEMISPCLQTLYPHQWFNIDDITLTPISYTSPRGIMKVIEGNSFRCRYPVAGILPELPLVAKDQERLYNAAKSWNYVDTVFKQKPAERWGPQVRDTYWFGKALGKITRLVHIAQQIGHMQAHDLFLAELKNHVEDWLNGTAPHYFYYDKVWRTLIGYPAAFGSDTALSDHHFHYGYLLQAAACIAQYDSSWANASQYGEMIRLLIKDPANGTSGDYRFPFLRNYDVYAGHGWANGAQLFAAGNNQESSSESLNFSSSLVLWGAATGDDEIRNLGLFLFANEVQAVEHYWFDVHQNVFPKAYPEPTLGILWGNGGAYGIWWDGSIEELHGINFLPITGASLYLGRHPEYLMRNQEWLASAPGSGSGAWFDIHLAMHALHDPVEAVEAFEGNSGYTPEAGETKAHTYYWIHNLAELGLLDKGVTANIPTAAVFKNLEKKTYVIYNPKPETANIKFSDGFSIDAPAGSLAAYHAEDGVKLPSFSQGSENKSEGATLVWLKTDAAFGDVLLKYSKNGTIQDSITMELNDGRFEAAVQGLVAGDEISYQFDVLYLGSRYLTPNFGFVYQAGNDNIDQIEEADFTLTLEALSETTLSFIFQTKGTPADFIDIHFKINNTGVQHNFRMGNSPDKTVWSKTLATLKEGDKISYSFTYSLKGFAKNSIWREHIFSFDETPSDATSLKVLKGLLEDELKGIKFLFRGDPEPTAVSVHFKINEGPFQVLSMAKEGLFWILPLPGVARGDTITYFFSYSQQTIISETGWATHVVSRHASEKNIGIFH
jgi:endoglucanase Acf2